MPENLHSLRHSILGSFGAQLGIVLDNGLESAAITGSQVPPMLHHQGFPWQLAPAGLQPKDTLVWTYNFRKFSTTSNDITALTDSTDWTLEHQTMVQHSRTKIILLCGPQAKAAIMKAFPSIKCFQLQTRFTYSMLMHHQKIFIVCPPLAFNVADASIMDNTKLGEALKFAFKILGRINGRAAFFENASALSFIKRALYNENHFQKSISLEDLDQGMRLWLFERAVRTDEEITQLGKLSGSLARGMFILLRTGGDLLRERGCPRPKKNTSSVSIPRRKLPTPNPFDPQVWSNARKYIIFLAKRRSKVFASACKDWKDDFLDVTPEDLRAALVAPPQAYPETWNEAEESGTNCLSLIDESADAAIEFVEEMGDDALGTNLPFSDPSDSNDLPDLPEVGKSVKRKRSLDGLGAIANKSMKSLNGRMPASVPRPCTYLGWWREQDVYYDRYYRCRLPPPPLPNSLFQHRRIVIGYLVLYFAFDFEVLNNVILVRFDICAQGQEHPQRFATIGRTGDPGLRLAVEVTYQLPSRRKVSHYMHSHTVSSLFRANTLVDVLEDGVPLKALVETPRRWLQIRDTDPEYRRYYDGGFTPSSDD